jgi:hypothetical protein
MPRRVLYESNSLAKETAQPTWGMAEQFGYMRREAGRIVHTATGTVEKRSEKSPEKRHEKVIFFTMDKTVDGTEQLDGYD